MSRARQEGSNPTVVRPWRRRIIYAFLGLVAVSLLIGAGSGCVGYLSRACIGQLSILRARRPIRTVIADPQTSRAVRTKLGHILTVRKFARDRLGLTPGESYTSYSDIGRSAAVWNVSAAPELKLKPKTWWFPIVGRVPYLGFFSKAEAEARAAELRGKGYDVAVRPVAAYSTLGWFADPVLSPQLRYSTWYLTRIVIHESAHATIWFPGDVGFNESFASFVETQGALEHLRVTGGPQGAQVARRLRAMRESQLVSAVFRSYALRLRRMYARRIPDKNKRLAKARLIQGMKSELAGRRAEFQVINLKYYLKRKYNNAHFLSYLRYNSGQDYFRKEFVAARNNWPAFLKRMRALRSLSPEERARLLRP